MLFFNYIFNWDDFLKNRRNELQQIYVAQNVGNIVNPRLPKHLSSKLSIGNHSESLSKT